MWNAKTGNLISALVAQDPDWTCGVAVSPGGDAIAIRGRNNVTVWDGDALGADLLGGLFGSLCSRAIMGRSTWLPAPRRLGSSASDARSILASLFRKWEIRGVGHA